jgi:uncharacterized protein YndB with AHSA1/START domain
MEPRPRASTHGDPMKKTPALTVSTPSERELVMSRAFDAPRKLVFDALTRPELLKRWYGPPGWTLLVCEIDLRVGGAWRFVTRQPEGKQIGQRGVYREIVSPERLVNTESWEDWNPGEVLVTTVLTEQDARTTLTCTTLFPSQEVRDLLLESGMTKGAEETYDKLAACLASVVA